MSTLRDRVVDSREGETTKSGKGLFPCPLKSNPTLPGHQTILNFFTANSLYNYLKCLPAKTCCNTKFSKNFGFKTSIAFEKRKVFLFQGKVTISS